MKGSFLAKFVDLLILVLIVIMIVVLVALPFLVDKYVEFRGMQTSGILWIKIFLYLTAIPFIVLLVKAKELCNNILRDIPFCQSSIVALNVISLAAFIEFLLYAIGTIVIFRKSLVTYLDGCCFYGRACNHDSIPTGQGCPKDKTGKRSYDLR